MSHAPSSDVTYWSVRISRKSFLSLPEYSCSLPTGTSLGKTWRRNLHAYTRQPVKHLHFFDGSPVLEPLGERWIICRYFCLRCKDTRDVLEGRLADPFTLPACKPGGGCENSREVGIAYALPDFDPDHGSK